MREPWLASLPCAKGAVTITFSPDHFRMATSTPAPVLVLPPPDTGTNALVPEELHAVKPPVPIVSVWPYAVAAGLLALLAALVIAWWLRRRRKPSAPAPVLVPPHRRAQDRLRAALDLLHDPEAFTVRVADTLRVYLEERFQMNAPDRTSEEFLEEIQSSPLLTPSQKCLLADFLTRCDLVKFARAQPSETELRGLWKTAMDLVSETSDPTGPSHSP